MRFEQLKFEPGKVSEPKVKIEAEINYGIFVPQEFRKNPLAYFENTGKNIKPGEIKRDDTGRVREDPTAVKELPVWLNQTGNELRVIGKKINVGKGEIGKSGDPFYEYKILQLVNELGLPAPKPIAKIEQDNEYLILTEKVAGIGWYEKDTLKLKARGYTDEDIENLKKQAEQSMDELRQRFERAGIRRGWKLKDMIFDIDIENKRIKGITPTDWERTQIDQQKVDEYKRKSEVV